MYNEKPFQSQIEPGDLKLLKNLVVIFIMTVVLFLVVTITNGNTGSIFTVVGYAALTYGIYRL